MKAYQREILFQQQKKNKLTAYVLGALLGGLGAHRFYCGEQVGGAVYIVLLVMTAILPPTLFVTFVYLVFDFFYTSRLVDSANKSIRNTIELMEAE